MELVLLGIIALLVAINLFLLLKQKNTNEGASALNALIKFEQQLAQIEKQVKDDAKRNREESQGAFKLQREELTKSLTQFEERFENNSRRLNEVLKEVRRHYVNRALEQANNKKNKAADLLGLVNRQTLTHWLDKFEEEEVSD